MTYLTPAEREILSDLAYWALDQAHDSRGMGDPIYLWFLTDKHDIDDPNLEDACLEVERLIESAASKLTESLKGTEGAS